jgi:hypothetical protein
MRGCDFAEEEGWANVVRMTSKAENFLPLRLGGAMLIVIGLVLLGGMFWISGLPQEGARSGAAFVTESLPGYRFKPEILPRLGEIGGGALGLGLALLLIAGILKRWGPKRT